jgi:hypothetical protein
MTPHRQRIVSAAQAGLQPALIAQEFGVSANSINVILSQERAKGVDVPYFKLGRIPKSIGQTQREAE